MEAEDVLLKREAKKPGEEGDAEFSVRLKQAARCEMITLESLYCASSMIATGTFL